MDIQKMAANREQDVHVSTIDRVQGCEYDIVILLTSRSSCVDLTRCRRFGNVATSRARDQLVIIGHPGFMKAKSKHSSRQYRFWGHFLANPLTRLFSIADMTVHGVLLQVRSRGASNRYAVAFC